MIALIILFVAAAAAAPYHGMGYNPMPFHPEHNFERISQPYFGEDLFDTGRFWAELSTELRQLDNMLVDFYKRFPSSVTTQGIDGKEYKITIPLSDFEEKDIVVKARTGLLMIQAVHKYEGNVQKNYLDVRTLPNCVNVNGSWTYNQGLLKIIFPLKPEDAADVVTVNEITEVPVTQAPKESREEMENHVESSNQDADVGLSRGDMEKERELSTNEIWRNNVEATTYAVDLKDEVEFVPVRY